MADKSSQLVLNALTRAAAAASGLPWHGNKAAPGLFPSNALGKQAAQRCRDEGHLCSLSPPVPSDAGSSAGPTLAVKVRPVLELCTITDKGLAYLLSQVSPRQVLEDMVRVLEQREGLVGQLVTLAQQARATFEGLKANVEKVLQQVRTNERPTAPVGGNGELKSLFHDFLQGPNGTYAGPPAPTPPADAPTKVEAALLAHLAHWASAAHVEDCPLPELYRQAQAVCPSASIGEFHDALRRMHDAETIYLHPWGGPLYDMPEPLYALVIGHGVTYYASLRS